MKIERGMKLTLNGEDVFYNGTAGPGTAKVLVRSEEREVPVDDLRFPCPDWAAGWTVDEVAECLGGLGAELPGKLWGFLQDVPQAKRTPLGGDGTDGTVETPDGRLGAFGDKLDANWDRLDFMEQALILDRYAAEYE